MVSAPRRSARRIGLWAALFAAGHALAPQAHADGLPTVSLDLSALSSVEHKQIDGVALENRVVVRLLQEGFTVVAPRARVAPDAGAPAAMTVRVSLGGGGLRLWYVDDARQDERFVRWTRGDPLPELHWLVAQKVVELARSWRAGLDARAVPVSPPTAPTSPAPAAPQVVPEPPPQARPWRLGAGFGARSRAGRAEPVVTGIWAREGPRWNLEARGQGTWSRTSSLSAQDLELVLGVSRRWSFLPRWSFDAAVLIGPGVHRFSSQLVDDPHPSGLHAGLVLSTEVGLALRVPGALELSLRVAPGLAWPEISHTRGGAVLWRRTPFRLEAGILVQRRFE